MRIEVQSRLLPGKTFSERFVKAESLGFEGVELLGRSLPGFIKEKRSQA